MEINKFKKGVKDNFVSAQNSAKEMGFSTPLYVNR
jgi:hypothetical protein